MKIYADLHIHSKYSRATSKDLTLENLEKYARIKGIGLLGTGDFTHPKWLGELKKLDEADGVLKTKSDFPFILQAEIANIYSEAGKVRKIHNIILAPSIEVVGQINAFLETKGNLEADGRPIFGKMNCAELVEELMSISRDIELIPAHTWTPWFSIFGSMSGFDSVEECFGDQAKHIHALETGLSSDPEMNWRVSSLDKYNLISNSDAHSFWPWRIGRECNVFDIDLSYENVIKAIRTGKGFVETIEVDPAYGKYHIDGHRNCDFCTEPGKIKGDVCPKCGKKMTIGVLHRVEELADRKPGYVPKGKPDFRRMLPLSEIISMSTGVKQMHSKKVMGIHEKLIGEFKNEFAVLLNTSEGDLKNIVDEKLAGLILKNRIGKIKVKPGYDGVYGEAVFEKTKEGQKNLEEF
ncbi:MAG: endonuclease Q family protein [archaeon]